MSTDKPLWYAPEDPTPKHRCPCCDHVSLPERGSFLICPVCFWEDDGQHLDALDIRSGPNHGITLREGRENFVELGAYRKEMVKHTCSVQERSRFEFKPRDSR